MIKSKLSTCLSNPRHFPRGYFLTATGLVKSFAASFLFDGLFYDLNKCLSRVNVVSFCHSSSLALTNISPVYLRLKSPILLVSWLPLTEEAGVTEIGQFWSWRREKRERSTAAEWVQSVRTGNTQTSTQSESVGKYWMKKIFAENIDTENGVHTRVIMRTTETLSDGRRPGVFVSGPAP